MALLFSLFILIIQADFIASECLPGYYERFGSCLKCQLYCKACNSSQCYTCYPSDCHTDICDYANCDKTGCSANINAICSDCPDGFYMENDLCLRCDNVNCKCTSASGCDECLPGHYGTSSFCNNNCLIDCLTCYSSTLCTECISGKYGHSCEHSCTSTCENGTCDKESGTCVGECASDQYLDSGICKPCPSNRCSTCVNSTYCTSCKRPYQWSPTCAYYCTGCYNSCDRENGCSAGCSDPVYYNTYNEHKKGYECIRCFNKCLTCDNETYCTSCKDNYWGRQCRYTCDNCDGTCDKENGCVNNCKPGYYREQGDTGYDCIRCFSQCQTCDNETYCTSCKDNYWGEQCRYSCDNCDGACDKEYGCVNNCKLGFHREQADTGYECKPCSINCEQCLDFAKCIVCEDGYYISGTSFNCIPCPVNCKDKACDKRNGACTRGCSIGNTGHRCNEECPNNCVECDQFNSSKCDSCKREFYGDMCEQHCSKTCKQEHGFHECHEQNGSCNYGCEDAYWSKTCTETCADGCFDNLCNETNGACLHGCKSGYYGVNCSLKCPDSYENSSVTQQSLANLDSNKTVINGLAVAVGILGIVAMTLTVGIVFLWKSRKTNHPTTQRCQEDDRTLADSHQTRNSELTTSDVGGYEDLTSVRPEEKMYSTITNEYENTNLSL